MATAAAVDLRLVYRLIANSTVADDDEDLQRAIVNVEWRLYMKVTVCFDKVRVVVPCGNGQMLVSELMEEATARYRKALGKAQNHWITVRTLKSSDGGILDPDDHVADVTDDREQILAEFCEGVCPRLQSGADGTSASSAGTSSPDPFTAIKEFTSWNNNLGKDHDSSHNHKGVSPSQLATSSGKPILDKSVRHMLQSKVSDAADRNWLEDASKKAVFDPFARLACARKSVMFSTMQWIESQEVTDPKNMKDEPEGPAGFVANPNCSEDIDEERDSVLRNCEIIPSFDFDLDHSNCKPAKFLPIASTRMLGKRIEMTLIKGNDGLGFSITTRDNFSAGDAPIYVKTILPRGAAIRDGRLHPGDRLLEVNRIAMSGKSQEEATSILRSLCSGCTVNLVVSRQTIVDHLDQTVDDQGTNELCEATEQTPAVGRKDEAEDIAAADRGLIKATTVPEKDQTRDSIDAKSEGDVKKDARARDGGQNEMDMSKHEDMRRRDTTVSDTGLRNITDKDQVPGLDRGQVPVCDRVQASVNDKGQVPVTTDKDQAPVADKDQAPVGNKGQASVTDKDQMGEDTSSVDMGLERLTITIARTEHQGNGLGISVKGKTLETASDTKDLGLFIWSILPGGAAAKDGRLKPDDRLMGINGKLLIGCTNNDAMDILRGVLQCNACRSIELTIVRNRLTPDMFLKDNRTFRVPIKHFVSCTQPRGEIASNFSDTISAYEKVGCKGVVCGKADSNVSRLIERKEAIPVESYVWLPSVAENPAAGLRSRENSLAVEKSDCDDGEMVCEAKEFVTSSEQQTSANNCRQMDGYACGGSSAVKDSESSSTSELDSELGPLGVFSRDGFGRQSVSEKRKACVDPRSFALYHQIKHGKRENVQNPVKRALSIESMLNRKLINSTISPIVMLSDENLKRFNSFESMQTVAQSCLQRTMDPASQNQSQQQDFKQLSFRDAFAYCYESQLITAGENINSESSGIGRSVLEVGERKTKKKKVLRGLSSVFRFGKTKKNSIDGNVSYCLTEAEARQLNDKRRKLQSNLVPDTSINERLLQTAKFSSGSANDVSTDQAHAENDPRREHCCVLDRSAQSNNALCDRPPGISHCQIDSRQVQCHHCLTAMNNEHDKMEDSSLREFQNSDQRSIFYSNQNPQQAQHLLPNRQREQCSNCSESASNQTRPMFISTNKTRFQESHGRQKRQQKIGGKFVSHNASDPGSRRFPCCHAAGDDICFPEGYYHKLESSESVNTRWSTPKHLPAENSSVSECDTSGLNVVMDALRTDQNMEINVRKDLSCGKHHLTAPNAAQI